jgi:hypothetical protein
LISIGQERISRRVDPEIPEILLKGLNPKISSHPQSFGMGLHQIRDSG